MANIHPNSIFRWEDAASLEHACWACPTKANSPRALQTCYGVHSMPCVSYHPTMHAVGAAHRCSGCITTREMHDARHREIAELMAEYRIQESQSPPETPTRRVPLVEITANVGPRTGQNRPFNLRRYGEPEEIAVLVLEDLKNYGEAAVDDDNDDDTASLSSYAPSSTATTDQCTKTSHKKPTKAEIRAQKKAKKSARSASKALKNQNRNLAIVTSAEVEEVARILHGEERDATSDGSAHPLATDKTVEDVISRNLNFVKNIQAHKAYLFKSVATGRKEVKERKRLKKRESKGETGEETIEMEEVVSAIMIKLGVNPVVVAASMNSTANTSTSTSTSTPLKTAANSNPSGRKRAGSSLSLRTHTPSSSGKTTSTSIGSGASKATVNIAVKLRAAIKTDLEKHENEVHARYIRAGGFWRYVGKTVFERMTDFARETDVATGESWEKKWAREGKSSGSGAGAGASDDNHDDGDDGDQEE